MIMMTGVPFVLHWSSPQLYHWPLRFIQLALNKAYVHFKFMVCYWLQVVRWDVEIGPFRGPWQFAPFKDQNNIVFGLGHETHNNNNDRLLLNSYHNSDFKTMSRARGLCTPRRTFSLGFSVHTCNEKEKITFIRDSILHIIHLIFGW